MLVFAHERKTRRKSRSHCLREKEREIANKPAIEALHLALAAVNKELAAFADALRSEIAEMDKPGSDIQPGGRQRDEYMHSSNKNESGMAEKRPDRRYPMQTSERSG